VNEPTPAPSPPAPSTPPAASTSATSAPAKNTAATGTSANPATPAATPVTLVPATRTAIFPKDQTKAFIQAVCFIPPPGITDYWTPTAKDLDGVESGLAAFLKSNGHVERHPWAEYFRQIVGVLEGKNQFILLSYFIDDRTPEEKKADAANPQYDPDHWKKKPFWYNDGGETYFRVLYDMQAKQFTWYERNGDA